MPIPMEETPEEMEILVSPEQLANAPMPMEVTPDGIKMLVSAEQYWNA